MAPIPTLLPANNSEDEPPGHNHQRDSPNTHTNQTFTRQVSFKSPVDTIPDKQNPDSSVPVCESTPLLIHGSGGSGSGSGSGSDVGAAPSSDPSPSPSPFASPRTRYGTTRQSSEFSQSSIKRSISVFRFSMIAFFLVCGGPFGIEAIVRAGGPLYTFLGFFIAPLVWSIPQALMTAELSCLIRDNGGYIVWVQMAFGDFAGWLSGFNGFVSFIFDLALYPSLCASYLSVFIDLTDVQAYLVKVSIVVLCLAINSRGLKEVGNFSAVITIAVILPFFVSFVFQFNRIIDGGYAWTQVPKHVEWGVFISTMLWSYTGWDSLGCMAGEVANPAYTYTRGSLVTLIMVIITYSLPTFIGIQTHPHLHEWSNGAFADFAKDVGPWLAGWMGIASIAANLGMYSAGLSASSRALWALAGGDSSCPTGVAHIPSFFARTWGKGKTPIIALLTHSILIAGLFNFEFTVLVQADMVLTCVRLLFEFASFLKFRYTWPDAPRDFKVPGGWWGAAAITIPKVSVVLFTLFRVDRLTWTSSLAINALGILIYIIRVWVFSQAPKHKHVNRTHHHKYLNKQQPSLQHNDINHDKQDSTSIKHHENGII